MPPSPSSIPSIPESPTTTTNSNPSMPSSPTTPHPFSSTSSTSSSFSNLDCRICGMSSQDSIDETDASETDSINHNLISPCSCAGSSNLIHTHCLLKWIDSRPRNAALTELSKTYDDESVLFKEEVREWFDQCRRIERKEDEKRNGKDWKGRLFDMLLPPYSSSSSSSSNEPTIKLTEDSSTHSSSNNNNINTIDIEEPLLKTPTYPSPPHTPQFLRALNFNEYMVLDFILQLTSNKKYWEYTEKYLQTDYNPSTSIHPSQNKTKKQTTPTLTLTKGLKNPLKHYLKTSSNPKMICELCHTPYAVKIQTTFKFRQVVYHDLNDEYDNNNTTNHRRDLKAFYICEFIVDVFKGLVLCGLLLGCGVGLICFVYVVFFDVDGVMDDDGDARVYNDDNVTPNHDESESKSTSMFSNLIQNTKNATPTSPSTQLSLLLFLTLITLLCIISLNKLFVEGREKGMVRSVVEFDFEDILHAVYGGVERRDRVCAFDDDEGEDEDEDEDEVVQRSSRPSVVDRNVLLLPNSDVDDDDDDSDEMEEEV